MGKQRERGGGDKKKKKKILFSCTSSRGPLFNCIIANEVVMQLQERGPSFLYLLMRVTLASAQTGVMKSQNRHSPRAPSNTLSVCLALRETCHPPSPSITRRRATLTGRAARSPESVLSCLRRRVSRFSDYLFISVTEERPWCSGAFYHPTHFLD